MPSNRFPRAGEGTVKVIKLQIPGLAPNASRQDKPNCKLPRYHSDEARKPAEGLDPFELSTSSVKDMLDQLRRSLRKWSAASW